MAYGNPYFGNNYYGGGTMYPTYQGNIMQPQQPQPIMQQPQQQYDPPIQAVKFVTTDEAKGFIVNPNQKVMLIDKDNSVFYIKGADGIGQSYTYAYKFEAIKNDAGKPEIEQTAINSADFVKKDDIKGFVTNDDLLALKDELTKSIEDFKKATIKKTLEKDIKDL